MVAFIFNVFGVLGLSQAFVFPGAHESDKCVSHGGNLNCTCENRDDIRMSASMNFDIVTIQVSGCGLVTVPFGAVSNLEISKIVFNDIHQMEIRPFAFVGAQTIDTLQMESVHLLNVDTHGFVGLSNVKNVIIRNISSMHLQEGAFAGISNIENFLIEQVNFVEIKDGAFALTNITLFRVSDSKFDIMASNSFLLHNFEEVLFKNCSIRKATNHSFSMSYVNSLTFSECDIGILDTNSIHLRYPGSFNFEACTIAELRSNSVTIMGIAGDVTFSNNVIKLVYENPLYVGSKNLSVENSRGENINIYANYNSFLCNCDISWMWDTIEPIFDFSSSFCIGTGIKLLGIVPILDSHRNCTAMEKLEGLGFENGMASRASAQMNPSRAMLVRAIMPFLCLGILYGLSVHQQLKPET